MPSKTEKQVQSSASDERLPNPYCSRCSKESKEEILVSVSPKILKLPKDMTSSPTLLIRNRNAFPVFFKVSTTNMIAFKPLPVSGKISPYGNATVTLQFYSPATPIRQHEEVIIMISENSFLHRSDSICRYCCKSHSTRDQKHQDRNLKKTFIERSKADEICRRHLAYDDDDDDDDERGTTCKVCNRGFASRKDIEEERLESENAEMDTEYHHRSLNDENNIPKRKSGTKHILCDCEEAYSGSATDCRHGSAMNGYAFQEKGIKDDQDISQEHLRKSKKRQFLDGQQTGSKMAKRTEHSMKQQTDDVQEGYGKYHYPRKPHIMTRVVESVDNLKAVDEQSIDSASDDSYIKKRMKIISERDLIDSESSETQEVQSQSSSRRERRMSFRKLFRYQNNILMMLTKINCKCSVLLVVTNISLLLLILMLLIIVPFFFK